MKEQLQRSLSRALAWLFAQQGADGGWHSKTYGQLKEGAAVTALALYAGSHCPEVLRGRFTDAIDRGFAFLDRGIARRGTIAAPDGTLDFPTYAAALWLSAARHLSRHEASERIIRYLIDAQANEARGFEAKSVSFGGWDFLGREDAQGITTGTNISVTRYVLEALAGGDDKVDEPRSRAIERGREYILRCQQDDGGFGFTCEPASLNNKAAYSDPELTKPRSYGTATCDGVLGLLASGLTATDDSVARGIAWLIKRPGLEAVPGFEGLAPELGWDRGLRFYYYAARAAVLRHFPVSEREGRQHVLAEHLIKLQNQEGFWKNDSDRMRENDPLIATCLALVALSSLTD